MNDIKVNGLDLARCLSGIQISCNPDRFLMRSNTLQLDNKNQGRRWNIVLRVAFVFILTMAMLSACTPGIEKPLGVYGDWSAYVLRDGDLQVCYAETKLKIAPEANLEFSDIRLQVSNRSFDGGSAIRFTEAEKLPGTAMVYIGVTDTAPIPVEYILDPDEPEFSSLVHVNLVEEMMDKEIEKLVMTLEPDWPKNTDEGVTPFGTYSLHGFIEAYDSLGRTCPDRPKRTVNVEPQPIALTDLSVITGTSLYFELSLTGPFFEPDKVERLTIRGVPHPYEMPSDEEMKFYPEYLLRYYTDRMEFYRNGTLVDDIGQSHPEIYGICLDPESKRLKMLMRSWSGGAGAAEITKAVYFVPETGIVSDVLHSKDTFPPPLVNCAENERLWGGGGKQFIPCQCAGKSASQAYDSVLDELVSDIDFEEARGTTDFSQDEIGNDTLSALLSRISRLEPFMRWDANSSFDIERFESPKFAILTVTYHNRARAYSSFRLVFVRQITDDFWTRVFYQTSGSRGFDNMAIYGFHDDETVDMKMCFEDDPDSEFECSSWHDYKRRLITVDEWLRKGAQSGLKK